MERMLSTVVMVRVDELLEIKTRCKFVAALENGIDGANLLVRVRGSGGVLTGFVTYY